MNRKLFPIATIALLLSGCGLKPFITSSTSQPTSESHSHVTTDQPSHTHTTSEQPTSESKQPSTSDISSSISSKTTTATSEISTKTTPTSESTTQSSTTIPCSSSVSTTVTTQPTSESTTTTPQPTSESTTTIPQPTSESITTVPQPTSESTTTVPQPTSESTTTPKPTSESTTIVPPTSESTTVIPDPTSESSTTIQPTSEESSGTSTSPIYTYTSVTEAISITSALAVGETTEESYTVIGEITTAITTMASGALQFKIKDLNGGSGRLYIDGAFSSVGTPAKGDTIVAVGTLKRHADTDYRMSRGSSIVDINPVGPQPTTDTTSSSSVPPITGTFTAKFYDENGGLIKSQEYNAYDTPSCTYEKESTPEYDYILKGWSLYLGGPVVSIQPITKNISYYAVIESKPYQFIGNTYSEFQIHFIELGNWYTGDCVYIKAGNNDILIDAGSRKNSATTIRNYLDDHNLVADGVFEYVIATHAHEDHISGFVGNAGSPRTGIMYNYEIDNLIQFNKHNTTSALYGEYTQAVEMLKQNGTNVYTCLEVYNSPSLRTISLGKNMSMTTLYQKYYEENASGDNDYSVCTLFTYGNQHYLFTGDLEAAGEKSLVESNSLPHCALYKGGHHGSKTSSTSVLMEAISPEVVCVCCCCGSDEYTTTNVNQFPTQEFVDRVGIYTEYIFVTTIATNNEEHEYESMNGNIVFSSNGFRYGLNCSNNNTILKDTDWFKANRTWPSVS